MSSNTREMPLSYRPDIDGLRAVAVLAVLGFHAFPSYFPGGFLGVDIFFVISGFLITGILLREHSRNGKIDLGNFYSRRIRRLFPALLVVLASTAILGYFLLFSHEFARLAAHVWASLFFVENILLAREVGYFDIASYQKPLLHFWSLAVEEQFYFVWPLTLLLLARRRRHVLWAILIAIIVSFALVLFRALPDTWNFYAPVTRMWEFGAGALVALWHGRGASADAPPGRHIAGWTSLVSLLAIAGCILFLPPAMRHPGLVTTIPVLATTALIIAGPTSWINSKLLMRKIVVWIGLISYPLYLWHWPLLSYISIVSTDDRGPAIVRIAALALSFALATATFLLIERPIRYGWQTRRAVTVLGSGTILLAAATGGAYLYRTDVRNQAAAQVEAQIEGAFWRFTANDICESRYGRIYRYFCIQSRDAEPTVLLFGDSHANQYYAGLVADPTMQSETILSLGSCEPSASLPLPKEDCPRQLEFATGSNSLELVIVGALWPTLDRMDDKHAGKSGNSGERIDRDTYAAALRNRIDALASSDVPIVIMGPKPNLTHDISDCYGRPLRPASSDCVLDRAAFEADNADLSRLLNDIADRHDNVAVFDPAPLFCGADRCSVINDEGLPLLRDDTHLSVLGSEMVVSAMLDWASEQGLLKR